MTFKIDKAGFYKNRKGEKVEITNFVNENRIAISSTGFGYWVNNGVGVDVFESEHHEDIIAHWEEPLALEEFAHETDCASKSPKMWAVADNQGEWLEVTSRKEAGEVAEKWLKETPTTTIDIWEKISCYTAEIEIKEIKI